LPGLEADNKVVEVVVTQVVAVVVGVVVAKVEFEDNHYIARAVVVVALVHMDHMAAVSVVVVDLYFVDVPIRFVLSHAPRRVFFLFQSVLVP
jgi:hypothetical protein